MSTTYPRFASWSPCIDGVGANFVLEDFLFGDGAILSSLIGGGVWSVRGDGGVVVLGGCLGLLGVAWRGCDRAGPV